MLDSRADSSGSFGDSGSGGFSDSAGGDFGGGSGGDLDDEIPF